LFLSTKKDKSLFVKYLEKKLHVELAVSLYFATANDKVVLQIQTKDAKILGYIKYPISELGVQRIENEIKAFDILSAENILDTYIFCDTYDDTPYIFLKELDGVIETVDKSNITKILENFKREELYTLSDHPRVNQLKKLCLKYDMKEHISKIEHIIMNSTLRYKLVYEHGDFAPWNIVKVKDEYIPFDLEYFEEDGLEYFDLIKYYYSIGSLLKSKDNIELKNFVCSSINAKEIESIYEIYIIKEKILKKMEKI
jgi:hypothetical protein